MILEEKLSIRTATIDDLEAIDVFFRNDVVGPNLNPGNQEKLRSLVMGDECYLLKSKSNLRGVVTFFPWAQLGQDHVSIYGAAGIQYTSYLWDYVKTLASRERVESIGVLVPKHSRLGSILRGHGFSQLKILNGSTLYSYKTGVEKPRRKFMV